MANINKTRKDYKKQLSQKENVLTRSVGKMGDGFGNLYEDDAQTKVYVRFGESPAIPVYNNRVMAENELSVVVGYSHENPNLYQVLSVHSSQPGGSTGGTLGSTNHARRHEWLAPRGGQDPLYVHLRAFTWLGIYVTEPNSMTVQLMRGNLVNASKVPLEIPYSTYDHTAHIPVTSGKAALVLHTIDDTGANVVTVGSEFDIDLLMPVGDRFVNMPAIPTDTLFMRGLVRVYNGQTAVQEGRTNRDIIDLRLAFFGGLAGAVEWDDVLNRPDGYPVQRNLSADLTLVDGESLVVAEYIDAGDYDIEMNGDSVIYFVDDDDTDARYLKLANMSALEAEALTDGNETLLHTHAGTGGGIAEAPVDGAYYGRRNSAWTNLKTYFDTLYSTLLASTAANDFQVGDGSGAWIKKTLAEVKTILGLGTAAYTASGDYAVAAKGVTNGDSHDHSGGDGGQIAYSTLSGLPTIISDAPSDDVYYARRNAAWTNIKTYFDTLYSTLASMSAANALDLTDGGATTLHSHAGPALPKSATMWHDQSLVLVGGQIETDQDTVPYYTLASQTAADDGDSWSNGFYIRAGTYTLNLLIKKSSSSGLLDLYIDDSLISSGNDFYHFSDLGNQIITIGSVIISSDGYHSLKGIVNGKNASSAGYWIYITKMWLVPSAY